MLYLPRSPCQADSSNNSIQAGREVASLSYKSTWRSLRCPSLQHPFDCTTPNTGKFTPGLVLSSSHCSKIFSPVCCCSSVTGRFLIPPGRQPPSSSPLLPRRQQLEATGLQQLQAARKLTRGLYRNRKHKCIRHVLYLLFQLPFKPRFLSLKNSSGCFHVLKKRKSPEVLHNSAFYPQEQEPKSLNTQTLPAKRASSILVDCNTKPQCSFLAANTGRREGLVGQRSTS